MAGRRLPPPGRRRAAERVRIAVVEKVRALMIVDGLKETGDHVVKVIGDDTGLGSASIGGWRVSDRVP